ncbi:conserved hypothetical protein [Bradyrhizobium sp. STM 3843]|uniref:hypothetical protein n=1 Tax=unclassified Bradyrhizobium TaxID=2631580 RepID=UPI000240A83A|nr:hypothetical protein [Bradyrhizobium sp. STM 3843]CCE04171.1 conserved hypothetical protein [Bradyrhizobium sp. STM 3843]
MFDTRGIRDELQALKNDLADALSKRGESILDMSENEVRSAAAQMSSALKELSDTLEREEAQLEKLVGEHPIAALASALALGVTIGWLLRRH